MFNRKLRPVPITRSDTTTYYEGQGGMLMGILVLTGGNLVVNNDKGTLLTISVPAAGAAGGVFPTMITGPFTKVTVDTTIADANMVGYQQA